MLTKQLLFNEVSELIEKINETGMDASVKYVNEDGMISVEFIHHDKRYPGNKKEMHLFDFQNEHNIRAWHFQIDKVMDGGLLDGSTI